METISKILGQIVFLLLIAGCSATHNGRGWNVNPDGKSKLQPESDLATIRVGTGGAHLGFGLNTEISSEFLVTCSGDVSFSTTGNEFQLPIGASNCLVKLTGFSFPERNKFTPQIPFVSWRESEIARYSNVDDEHLEVRIVNQLPAVISGDSVVRYEVWGISESNSVQIRTEGALDSIVSVSVLGGSAPSFSFRSVSYFPGTIEVLAECDEPLVGMDWSSARCSGDILADLVFALDEHDEENVEMSFLNGMFTGSNAETLKEKGLIVGNGELGLSNGGFRLQIAINAMAVDGSDLAPGYVLALKHTGSDSILYTRLVTDPPVNPLPVPPDPIPPPTPNPVSIIEHIGTKVKWDADGKNLTVDVPDGTKEGDLLVVVLHRTDDDLPLFIDGWTRVAECYKSGNSDDCATEDTCETWENVDFCKRFDTGTGHDLAQAVFYRVAGSDEPNAYEFDLNLAGAGKPGWALLSTIRGANNSDPVRAWAHTGNDGNSKSRFPSVYGEKGDMLLLSQSFDDYEPSSKFLPPDSTELYGYVGNSDETGFLYGKILESTGETGVLTTNGGGASAKKDALISLTIKAK